MTRFVCNLILFLAVASTAVSADAADMTLRESIVPSGSVVRLGEIAKITRAEVQTADQLAALPLMASPAPGTESTIRAQEIRELLVAHGVDLSTIRFDGAIRVTIRSQAASPRPTTEKPEKSRTVSVPEPRNLPRQQSGFRIPSPRKETSDGTSLMRRRRSLMSPRRLQELSESLQAKINQHVRDTSRDAMLTVSEFELQPRNAETLSQARGEISIDHNGTLQAGRHRFLVSFDTLGGPVRFPVFAAIERAEPVVVTVRAIGRGEVITAADIRIEPATGKRLRDSDVPLASIEHALGQEAARTLRPGQVLTEANCIPPIMVRRGDTVDVIAGGGGVRVRMRAIAKRDGRQGDTVDVETVADKRQLQARVTDYGTLAIVSAGRGRVTTAGTSVGRRR